MKYSVIISDPPWNFSDQLTMSSTPRGAEENYPTMSIADIKNLPVKEITADDGAILCLWVPSSLLQEGLDVMKAWSFQQKQTLVWVKTKKDASKQSSPNEMLGFGMGRLFRQTHEICLIGISSTAIYKKLANKSQRSVFLEFNEGHSIKPNNLHQSLGEMFPGTKKLEMYARRQYPGWECVGNEICNEDIKASLDKLQLKE
jgi:N6-adenosine-specific RNA methylase IME4